MRLRLVVPGIAVVGVLAALAGAGGLAGVVVVAAMVAAAVRLLEAVGTAATGAADRFPAAMATGGLVSLVAAAATHTPLLALGAVVCLGLELLGGIDLSTDVAAAEPAEF
jgi:hypothetical protein